MLFVVVTRMLQSELRREAHFQDEPLVICGVFPFPAFFF